MKREGNMTESEEFDYLHIKLRREIKDKLKIRSIWERKTITQLTTEILEKYLEEVEAEEKEYSSK